MSVHKLTQMDVGQIVRTQHDEASNAQRVIIVGGEMPAFNMSGNRQSLEQIKIEVPKYIDRIEYKTIEVPKYIDRIVEKEVIIEKPVYIDRVETKIEYKEIKVPQIIIQKEVVEVPVQIAGSTIVQSQTFPKWMIAFFVLQAISSIVLTAALIVK